MHRHLEDSLISPLDMEMFERTRKKRIYTRGEVIYEQDKNPIGLYCIQSGHVLLKNLDRYGNETAFRVVGPGELMGYRSFFAEEPHKASAQALDRCYICFHPQSIINRLLNSSIHLAKCFLGDLARDPGPVHALKLRNLKLPLRIRLIYLLEILKNHTGTTNEKGALTFDLPLKRLDIAALIGARPESVTRTIRELEAEGIAIFRNREVTLPHLEQIIEILSSEPDATIGNKDAEDEVSTTGKSAG